MDPLGWIVLAMMDSPGKYVGMLPSLKIHLHVFLTMNHQRMVTTIRDALDDYHCEIHSMVVEGNKAFCRMRFTGRHTGNLLGYPASGHQVAWMGAAEFTVKDSHIIKVWELGDVKALEEQLSGS